MCKPSVPWVARPHWLQLLSWQVMVEAYRRDTASKDQLISELKATKKKLDSEVKELRQELMQLQGDKKSMEAEQARLQKEVSRVQQQMAALEGHLESVQRERDEMETHLQVWGCADGEGSAVRGSRVPGCSSCFKLWAVGAREGCGAVPGLGFMCTGPMVKERPACRWEPGGAGSDSEAEGA